MLFSLNFLCGNAIPSTTSLDQLNCKIISEVYIKTQTRNNASYQFVFLISLPYLPKKKNAMLPQLKYCFKLYLGYDITKIRDTMYDTILEVYRDKEAALIKSASKYKSTR